MLPAILIGVSQNLNLNLMSDLEYQIASHYPYAITDDDLARIEELVPAGLWAAVNRAETHEETVMACDEIGAWIAANVEYLRAMISASNIARRANLPS